MFKLVSALLFVIALTGSLAPVQAQQIEGYSHRHWDAEEGAPPEINAIAQTRDGFLWLGTSNGLFRFDGLTFEKVEPARFNPRQSNRVTALAAAPDGALWVGYDYGGVNVYRNGRLDDANGESHPVGAVFRIAIDRNSEPWVAVTGRLGPQLKHLHAGHWRVHGNNDWLAPEALLDVLVAHDGTIWIAQARTILRLRPGAARPETVVSEPAFSRAIAEDDKGEIWVTTVRGLLQLTGERRLIRVATKGPVPGIMSRSALMLEDGTAWISGHQEGVIRVPYRQPGAGRAELVPVRARFLFRDREETIWGGGGDGLVNYIRSPVLRYAIEGSLSTGFAGGGAPGNPLFVATNTGIYELTGETPRLVLEAPGISALCSGNGQLLAISTHGDQLRRAGRWTRFKEPIPGFSSESCAITPDGRIWSTIGNFGIFRLENGTWVRQDDRWRGQFAVSDGHSGLYASQPLHAVLHLTTSVRPIWSGDAIAVGFVRLIKAVGAYTYIGGERGLARFDGHRFVTLEARYHGWLNGVTGLAVGKNDVWLVTGEGIVRLALTDFDHAFQDPAKSVPHQIFGTPQGIQSRSFAYQGVTDAELDSSGRPWFVTNRGLFGIDIARFRRNSVPPPVTIRSLEANGTLYLQGDVTLPAGTSRIQLDYVALSLTDPVRNTYRYRLDGVDRGWIDAGGKRQANYTGLGPGTYRFHVIAANPDGVWNETGAAVTLTIAPFFWQTWWFKGLLLLLLALLLRGLIQWRIRVVAERTRQRIEDRMAVREHIARELHDTLLQGFHGLVLRFQSVLDRLPPRHPVRAELESTLERADDVLQEGRDRVRFLREETRPVDLAPLLSKIAQDHLDGELHWTLKESGTARAVCAPVADDVARLVSEAVFNALRHARANALEIEVTYARDNLVIAVRDDGVGLDSVVKQTGGKEGHYGLLGMRERAERLGATFRIADAAPRGTEVELTIPARIAYR